MTAPDRAKLVSGVERVLTKLSRYDIANHRGKYALLRDESIAVLQRARDMIVADADKIGRMSNSHACFLQALSDIEDRDKRIAELEAKCSALEADARRLDWLESELTREQGGYFASLYRMNWPIKRAGIDDAMRRYEAVMLADAALASQPPEGKA